MEKNEYRGAGEGGEKEDVDGGDNETEGNTRKKNGKERRNKYCQKKKKNSSRTCRSGTRLSGKPG
jgi:hypothetical protein